MKNISKILIASICVFFSYNSAVAQSISVDSKNDQQAIMMMGGDMERSGSNL